MSREERGSPAATTRELPAGTGGPHWRAPLEARWEALLREVTELSLAYHAAAAARSALAERSALAGRSPR